MVKMNKKRVEKPLTLFFVVNLLCKCNDRKEKDIEKMI